MPCHPECRESCRGPTSYDCNSCMNFRVFTNEILHNFHFNCTKNCPPDFPYKIYDQEPHCSAHTTKQATEQTTNAQNKFIIAISVAIGLIVIFGIIVAIFLAKRRRNVRSFPDINQEEMEKINAMGITEIKDLWSRKDAIER